MLLNKLTKLPSWAKELLRSIYCNVFAPPRPTIWKTAKLSNRRFIKVMPFAEVKDYVIIDAGDRPVVVGPYTQINPFCVIYGGSGVYIGTNVMIGPHCMIAAGSHEFRQVSKPMRLAGDFSKGPITIEDDVWIGANCTITDGVTIATGAVVGANSVVTKDVQPYDIVAGCPAKKIGNRHDYSKAGGVRADVEREIGMQIGINIDGLDN